MSHRQILRAMTGLLAALFTAMLSSTIVSTALPTIIGDLQGTQSQYTWIITASLLATTVTTPIWGKLSDLFSKKVLVQLAIVVFVARLGRRRAWRTTSRSSSPAACSRASAWAA